MPLAATALALALWQAGKDNPTFELAGAKVGDVVWVGHFSTDLGEGGWVTAPFRTREEAAAAARVLAKSANMPTEVRKSSGEPRAIKATIE